MTQKVTQKNGPPCQKAWVTGQMAHGSSGGGVKKKPCVFFKEFSLFVVEYRASHQIGEWHGHIYTRYGLCEPEKKRIVSESFFCCPFFWC